MNQRRRWGRPSHSCNARELSQATNLHIPYVFFKLVFCSLQTGQKKVFYNEKKLTRLKILFRSLFIMHSIYIHQNHFCTRHILLIIFIPSFHLLLFAVPYVALHISIYLLSFPSSLTSKIFVFATFVCACIRYHLRYSNTMQYGI